MEGRRKGPRYWNLGMSRVLLVLGVFPLLWNRATGQEFADLKAVHYVASDFSQGSSPTTEVIVEFDSDNLNPVFNSDDSFVCADFLDILNVVNEESPESILFHALCRYCAEDETRGVFILPEFFLSSFELGIVPAIQLVESGVPGEVITVLDEFSPPFPVRYELLDRKSISVQFDDSFTIIRGDSFRAGDSIPSTNCSEIINIDSFSLDAICNFTISDSGDRLILEVQDVLFDSSFSDFIENGIQLASDTFYNVSEIFGIFPSFDSSFFFVFPPQMDSVALNDDLTLSLIFSEDTDQRNFDSFDCSRMFRMEVDERESTIDLFTNGSQPVFCSIQWSSPRQAILTFTETYPFFSFVQLSIKSFPSITRIARDPSNGFGFAFGSDFFSSNEKLGLNFTMNGPTNLTSCDQGFVVTAVQTGGPALQANLVFSVSANEVPIDNFCEVTGSIISCVLPPPGSETERVFTISGTALDPLLGQSIPATGLVFEITQDLTVEKIPVLISGVTAGSTVSVQRGTAITFVSVLGDFSSCLENVLLNFVFGWSIDGNTVSTTRRMTIGGNSLEPGIYEIVYFVDAPGTDLSQNEIIFFLEITPAPLVAVSSIGDFITLDEGTNITLDASRSCNPNEGDSNACQQGLGFVNFNLFEGLSDLQIRELTGLDPAAFSVEWVCVNCNELEEADQIASILSLTDLNQAKVVLSSDLPPGSYDFLFQIIDLVDSNDANFSFSVDIIEAIDDCPLPAVTISPIDAKANVETPLTLFATVEGYDADPALSLVDIAWSQITTAAANIFDVNSPLLKREDLFIPANTLIEGAEYTFLLVVRPKCDVPILPSNTARIQFETNRRPSGGTLILNSDTGVAVNDAFVLTASNWVDSDGDLPLLFSFESIFISESEAVPDVFDPQDTVQLTPFSSEQVFSTILQLPPIGKRTFLISVARDALNAVSNRRLGNSAEVFVLNPFVEDNEPNIDLINVDDIIILIDNLIKTGDDGNIPQLCSSITSALNEFGDQLGFEVDEFFAVVRDLCFRSVALTLDTFLDNNETDVDVVNTVANSIATISANAKQLDADLITQVNDQTNNLINLAKQEVEKVLRGNEDPLAASILPVSFKVNIINSIANILNAFDALVPLEDGSNETNGEARTMIRRSKLLQEDGLDPCVVLEAARGSVEDLANLENSFVVQGAPQVEASSEKVLFSALRESLNGIGASSNQLDLPSGTNGNGVQLPSGFFSSIQGDNGGVDGNTEVNIVVTQWNTLIRCEDRSIQQFECTENYTYPGPREDGEGSIISLDFFPFEAEVTDPLAVPALENALLITFDKPIESYAAEALDECKDVSEFNLTSEDEFVCGFFDDVSGDFITDGCVVADITEDKIVCSCLHATDFAAWTAFKHDVVFTFSAQIILSELAETILLTAFPIIAFFALLLFFWAQREDQADSQKILRGALARVKLIRIMNQRSKAQFFDNFEQARLQEMMLNEDQSNAQLISIKNVKVEIEKSSRPNFFKLFLLALRYEHSLFGLYRYDQNFPRVQRVAVFFAVVIANFGAAALVFELRSNVFQVSILFTVIVSFAAAFLVSVPIKLFVKAIFRSTENKVGSDYDMVSNMYKIMTRLESADGFETESDNKLVDAIHKYVAANDAIKRVKTINKVGGKPSYAGKKPTKGKSDISKVRVEEDGEDEGGDMPQNAAAEVVAQIVEDDGEDEYGEDLVVAKEAFKEARKRLYSVTTSARSAWSADIGEKKTSALFYTSYSRIQVVRKQSNGFMKFMASIGDEPSPIGKPRRARFSYWVTYINWFILSLVLAFYVFYMIKFIGTRQEAALNPPGVNDPDTELTESDIIVQWLLGGIGGVIVSYFIAEPLIAFIRYVISPWIVTTCGRNRTQVDEIPEYDANDETKKTKNIREDNAHYGFDVLADVIESFF